MVTRVWGKADSFELVFSPLGNDVWNAIVPPDLEDGQYIVELYCEDDMGNRAYWTGILYLNNRGQVCVRIEADKFKVWLVGDIDTGLQGDTHVEMEADIELAMQGDQRVWLEPDLKLHISFTGYLGRG